MAIDPEALADNGERRPEASVDTSDKYNGDIGGMVIEYADGSMEGSFDSDEALKRDLARLSDDDDEELQESDSLRSMVDYLKGRSLTY